MNEAAEGDNIGMHWRYWRQIVKCLLFPCFFWSKASDSPSQKRERKNKKKRTNMDK
jgi:hypothetical protein